MMMISLGSQCVCGVACRRSEKHLHKQSENIFPRSVETLRLLINLKRRKNNAQESRVREHSRSNRKKSFVSSLFLLIARGTSKIAVGSR